MGRAPGSQSGGSQPMARIRRSLNPTRAAILSDRHAAVQIIDHQVLALEFHMARKFVDGWRARLAERFRDKRTRGGVLLRQEHENKSRTQLRPYVKKLLRFLLGGGWRQRGSSPSRASGACESVGPTAGRVEDIGSSSRCRYIPHYSPDALSAVASEAWPPGESKAHRSRRAILSLSPRQAKAAAVKFASHATCSKRDRIPGLRNVFHGC